MSLGVASLVVGVSGFIALSYEIVWFRAYAFVSRTSPATFGVLLGFYLLGLAVGALVSRRFCGERPSAHAAAQLRPLSAFVFLANVLGFLVLPGLAFTATVLPWGFSLPLVALSAAALGATLPLVSHAAVRPDHKAGSGVSLLYLANILGSALGSLATGFVLMDLMSLEGMQLLLLVLGLAVAVAIAAAALRRVPVRIATAALVTVALALLSAPLLYGGLWERLLFKTDYVPGTSFAHVVENRHGVITVTEDGTVYGGGAFDGVFSVDLLHDRNWIIRAYALAALHPAPKRVLMVGLSSGSWARVVTQLPGFESLTAVEINPGYLELIPRYPMVADLLEDERVRVVIDDGRHWLHRHPDERFDLIVQNTTWHWRAHSTNLLSREYMELTRAHLAPGGILYFNTTFSEDAMRTAAEVFPHALRIFNFMAASDAPLAFDAARWERTLRTLCINGHPLLDLSRKEARTRLSDLLALPSTLDAPPQKCGLESGASLLSRTRNATVITDDNMICEWRVLNW